MIKKLIESNTSITNIIEESLKQNKYTITFRSSGNSFYVPDNTINSFISLLQNEDSTTYENHKRGVGNNQRIIYIKTLLNTKQIISVVNKFIKKYDTFFIEVVKGQH